MIGAMTTPEQRVLRGAIVAELWVAARYANDLAAAELERAGVSLEDYGFLSFVGMLQPVTRTELASVTGIRRTTLRDSLRRMIEKGHVHEAANPQDGRSTLLTLTPEGQAIFDRGLPAFQRVLKRIDEALDGCLDEHERVVRRVRVALQGLAAEHEPRA
jgi:DNA-binding MarR family transcriptional regulator